MENARLSIAESAIIANHVILSHSSDAHTQSAAHAELAENGVVDSRQTIPDVASKPGLPPPPCAHAP